MDFVDFVVHVFHKDTRDYYNIERLWADAPTEKLAPPVPDTQDLPAWPGQILLYSTENI